MLIINSFGLQHSLKDSRANVAHFFMRCYTISMSCAALVRDELGPSGLLKYGPDAYIVLASYSALTLLKVRGYFTIWTALLIINFVAIACLPYSSYVPIFRILWTAASKRRFTRLLQLLPTYLNLWQIILNNCPHFTDDFCIHLSRRDTKHHQSGQVVPTNSPQKPQLYPVLHGQELST